MSRFLTMKDDGTYFEEIESMDVCKWRLNEVCCNYACEEVGDYPYPTSKCEGDCEFFEKEDGVVEETKEAMIKMTNRQWLMEQMQNMSDEEFSEAIKWDKAGICKTVNSRKCNISLCENCKIEWLKAEHKEIPKLSDTERVILENVDEVYKWIVRDKNGYLKTSKDKPEKEYTTWERGHGYISMGAFNHLFQFIKWEDTEPYNIEELLKCK